MAADPRGGGPSDTRPAGGAASPSGATDLVVDARGRPCPLPVIDAARAVAALTPGTVVALVSDDPASLIDVPAWCRMTGHALLDTRTESPGYWRFRFTIAAGTGRERTR